MTGLGVGRTSRTPYPTPCVSPTGVSAPLPPPSQEAERRTERRAHRTGFARWGLRVLVVGGLAGAAWLLTGAAAQAADRADVPVDSLLGSVSDGFVVDGRHFPDGSGSIVDGFTTAPVRGVLKAAAQPLEAAGPAAKHHVVDDVVDVPRRVIARPAEMIDNVVHGPSGTLVDTATGGVDRVLREVAGPIRLTGGPANAQQRLTAVTDDVVTAPAQPGALSTPRALAVSSASSTPFMAPTPSVSPMQAVKRPQETRVALFTPALHGKAYSAQSSAQHRMAAAHAVTATAETVATERTPDGGGPEAPLRLHVGDVSGTPTTGSGTRTEGGSAAFLPAGIVSSTMACHALPIASDVEVRCHDAEAPTVSPD